MQMLTRLNAIDELNAWIKTSMSDTQHMHNRETFWQIFTIQMERSQKKIRKKRVRESYITESFQHDSISSINNNFIHSFNR